MYRRVVQLASLLSFLLLQPSCGGDAQSADDSSDELGMGSSSPDGAGGTADGAASGTSEPDGVATASMTAPSGTAGVEGMSADGSLPVCSSENQPQTRGSNASCYSPFYNLGGYVNPDVLGCDCEPCDHRATCVNGIQYLCGSFWNHKEVGSCDVPNACVEIWLRTFRSEEMDDCERLAGGFLVGDAELSDPVACRIELTFSNFLQEQRFAAGSRDGDYRCDGMNVTGIFGPTEIDGVYDPFTGVLTWDGMEMQPVEQTR
jgi:hypothetical protein